MTKPREPAPTVAFVDDSCTHYRAVFPNVRQCEQFTRRELGLVAETKRQSLPRLAQATKADPHAFHHFFAQADWSVQGGRAIRLELTRQALRERPFILGLDETR
jgi:SRSO17 transposase